MLEEINIEHVLLYKEYLEKLSDKGYTVTNKKKIIDPLMDDSEIPIEFSTSYSYQTKIYNHKYIDKYNIEKMLYLKHKNNNIDFDLYFETSNNKLGYITKQYNIIKIKSFFSIELHENYKIIKLFDSLDKAFFHNSITDNFESIVVSRPFSKYGKLKLFLADRPLFKEIFKI